MTWQRVGDGVQARTSIDPALDFAPELPCEVRHKRRCSDALQACGTVAEHVARLKCEHCGHVATYVMCTPHRVKLLAGERPIRHGCRLCGHVDHPTILSVRPL